MNKRGFLIIAALVALAALLAGSAVMAADPPAIDWWVIGGGGGQVSEADYTVSASVGQAVAGTTGALPFELCAGFWCRTQTVEGYIIRLPIIVRSP